jgi:hypothetical protein
MKLDAATLRTADKVIEIRTRSWKGFERKLEELFSAHSQLEREGSGGYVPHLLFRGQSKASYGLAASKAKCNTYLV